MQCFNSHTVDQYIYIDIGEGIGEGLSDIYDIYMLCFVMGFIRLYEF